MNKTKKIKLNNLEVASFLTSLNKTESKTVNGAGGIVSVNLCYGAVPSLPNGLCIVSHKCF